MTQNKWGFPLIIVAVLLVTGLLTVLVPTITRSIGSSMSGGGSHSTPIDIPAPPVYQENVRIDVDGYITDESLIEVLALGEFSSRSEAERTYTSLSLLGVITAIVIGGLIAFTIPIAGLVYLGARSTTANNENESYEASVTAINNKTSAWYKEQNKLKPVTGKPDTHERPSRDGWAAGFMVVFMSYFFGYAMGEGISVGLGGTMGAIFFFAAIIGSYFYFRPARMEAVESTSYGTVNYGTIWVVLSGAIVMGLGIGLMYVVLNGGDPFPWIKWTPGPRIDWQWFVDWFNESGLSPADWN